MKLFKRSLLVLFVGLSISANAQVDSANADLVVFSKVEVEAYYPGGEQAWRQFLQKNLNAEVPIKNSAPSGYYQVWVQFVVSRDGSLSDIKALTSMGYGMEAEVLRILRRSGKWAPAQQGGRFVKAYRKQPVTFAVIDENFDITTKTPYVLFTGIENPVSVDVPKVKDEDLQFTISQGTITRNAAGNMVVKVSRPGRVIIEIYNARKNKKIGAASFEVRTPGETSAKPAPDGSN